MTPEFRERLKTAGGFVVTFCLAVYVWQGVPFLFADADDLEPGVATVISRQAMSLSGATNETAMTFQVRFATADGQVGRGEVSSEQYDALSVEDSTDVVFWGGRCLLRDDVRWLAKHNRRYWFMLTATGVFGMVSVRRLVMRRRA